MDVVEGNEPRAEGFPCEEEMSEISPAETVARIAGTYWFQRTAVVARRSLADIQPAAATKRGAVPSFPRRHDAIEEVDARAYGTGEVVGPTDAH